ncbi:hypothetical protein BKA56DRAFT_279058 [Ilyonectria sp. MPI-CAGE-AT-0026]|nr:hypothetical protein BKA56DRAFT_279058 [Ilyonectria sp. MPI-CAGE-AT-0026]
MLEPQGMRGPLDQTNAYGHSRSRTTSSNVFPMQLQHPPMPTHLAQPGHNLQHSRRSPSVNTFSTASSIPPPAAYRTNSNTELRRSISSRSGGSPQPSGYVALLRKQKATVWCDRAQYEDPRIAAQQRAAKMRATLEVTGGARPGAGGAPGRTSTGLSTTGKVSAKIPKIRHHAKTTPDAGYAMGENHVGVGGVPMRLSATEVEEAKVARTKTCLPWVAHNTAGPAAADEAAPLVAAGGSPTGLQVAWGARAAGGGALAIPLSGLAVWWMPCPRILSMTQLAARHKVREAAAALNALTMSESSELPPDSPPTLSCTRRLREKRASKPQKSLKGAEASTSEHPPLPLAAFSLPTPIKGMIPKLTYPQHEDSEKRSFSCGSFVQFLSGPSIRPLASVGVSIGLLFLLPLKIYRRFSWVLIPR